MNCLMEAVPKQHTKIHLKNRFSWLERERERNICVLNGTESINILGGKGVLFKFQTVEVCHTYRNISEQKSEKANITMHVETNESCQPKWVHMLHYKSTLFLLINQSSQWTTGKQQRNPIMQHRNKKKRQLNRCIIFVCLHF